MLFVCHPKILHKHCLQFLFGLKWPLESRSPQNVRLIMHFYVMQRRLRNVQKSAQSCCFANLNLLPSSRASLLPRRCHSLSPIISVIRMGLQQGRTTQQGIFLMYLFLPHW